MIAAAAATRKRQYQAIPAAEALVPEHRSARASARGPSGETQTGLDWPPVSVYRELMPNLDRYRMPVRYKGFHGLSEIGFKKRDILLGDLFPTADEVVLSIAGCLCRLDESAALIYEIPGLRLDVVETDRVLELALEDPKGRYVGLIIDVLARDANDAEWMMADIETTCGFVRARLRDAMGIMDISEEDHVQRLRESLRLLAADLGRERP